MTSFAATEPESDPAVERMIVESRAQLRGGLRSSERTVEGLSALGFLAASVLMALTLDSGQAFDLPLAAALVTAYALASRVLFHSGSVWAFPSQVVLVPMLLVLPTELVPALVAIAMLLSRVPDYAKGTIPASRAIVGVADAWYSVAPALVLLLGNATVANWDDWPIYLAALAAQFGFEGATAATRIRLAVGVDAADMFKELRGAWVVDALLTPIGLLAAFAATDWQWAPLLVLPLIGLIKIFAHEREARIENALTLSSAYRGTAHLLGELLSTNHEYTGHHSRSVVVLAHQVGEKLGLDEATLRDVEFGALLHDVGKMAVPNEIINKPGRLTAEEWELVKTHTIQGHEMLERIGGVLAEVGAVVRSHHERYDGRGYPDGLAGEEIPVASRVIAACDSFNAMTTHRSYRPAMTIPEAIAELRRESGKQFDPSVVEALVEIVESWSEPGPETAEAAERAAAPLQPA